MVEKTEFLRSMIDVGVDHVVCNFPDLDSIVISDRELDSLFTYPELLEDFCSAEQCDFWNDTIPHIMRIRNQKRELYKQMGFWGKVNGKRL